jgi:hypothetical protein
MRLPSYLVLVAGCTTTAPSTPPDPVEPGWTTAAMQVPALTTVWAASPSDVWIGGTEDTLRHFDGARWTASSPSGDIAGIWGTSPDDVWAWNGEWVGHDVGGTWSWSDLGLHASVECIAGTATTDAWRLREGGLVERWNGTRWSMTTVVNTQLRQLWALDSGHAWATASTTIGGGVLSWSGSSWTTVDLPAGAYDAITGTAANDVWAAAPDTGVYHYDGSEWALVPTGEHVAALSARTPDDAWAVGCAGEGDCTDVLHWDGATWTATPVSAIALVTIAAVAPGKAWAVGADPKDSSKGVIVRN